MRQFFSYIKRQAKTSTPLQLYLAGLGLLLLSLVVLFLYAPFGRLIAEHGWVLAYLIGLWGLVLGGLAFYAHLQQVINRSRDR